MSSNKQKLRVAIVGGGIAGASLFHALLKHLHLDVHIFEAAPAFREAGAAVGLTENAQAALKLIGPSAVKCFERAGAVSQRGVTLMLAEGPDKGETVARVGGERNVVGIVHRAEFLRELLAGAPADQLHVSKKLAAIDQKGEDVPVVAHFTDGTKHECDILIGADGIHSSVRRFILGASDPASVPVSAGWWSVLVLKPYAEAEAVLDKEHLDINSPGEIAWIGDGAVVFHNILSEGKLAQFAIMVSCDSSDAPGIWQRDVSADEIKNVFASWPPRLSKAVNELICDQPTHTAVYFWDHLHARSYVKGAVGITGDAAHAMTPWQGSGAGMSIEDAMILSELLGRAESPTAARVALQVYNLVRKPRTQRVAESSRVIGLMSTNRYADTGLSADRLREEFRHRWDFILGFDVAEHKEHAVRLMEAELSKV